MDAPKPEQWIECNVNVFRFHMNRYWAVIGPIPTWTELPLDPRR